MKDLQAGEWKDTLPSERNLCAHYQVSRPSLRQALSKLEAEGWIRTLPRQIRRICRPPFTKTPHGSSAPPRITFLSAYPLNQLEPFAGMTVLALRQILMEDGCRLDVEASPDFTRERISGSVEGVVKSHPSAGWILYRAPEVLQHWFADRNIPTVVMGSSYPSVCLPCVDLDHRAISRHAAGLLLGKGHRPERLCLLLTGEHLLGIAASRKGFLEALGGGSGAGDPRVVTYADRADLGRQLAGLFQRDGLRPTGILVQRPVYALSVLGYLTAHQHLTPPRDVSIIALDDDPSLRYAVPEITRYTKNPERFVRRLLKLLRQRIENPFATDGQTTLAMPDLIPGETIGPPPA